MEVEIWSVVVDVSKSMIGSVEVASGSGSDSGSVIGSVEVFVGSGSGSVDTGLPPHIPSSSISPSQLLSHTQPLTLSAKNL